MGNMAGLVSCRSFDSVLRVVIGQHKVSCGSRRDRAARLVSEGCQLPRPPAAAASRSCGNSNPSFYIAPWLRVRE